jgi:hypothetical protein
MSVHKNQHQNVGDKMAIVADYITACRSWDDIHTVYDMVVAVNKGGEHVTDNLQKEKDFIKSHDCKKLAAKSEWQIVKKMVPFNDMGLLDGKKYPSAFFLLASEDDGQYWIWAADDYTASSEFTPKH